MQEGKNRSFSFRGAKCSLGARSEDVEDVVVTLRSDRTTGFQSSKQPPLPFLFLFFLVSESDIGSGECRLTHRPSEAGEEKEAGEAPPQVFMSCNIGHVC